ncbi:MAG TPA: hypothetical protein VFG87_21510 [Amycolatopsis sp.]|nr:hypothetical protein [Amycolatopsis sp.]
MVVSVKVTVPPAGLPVVQVTVAVSVVGEPAVTGFGEAETVVVEVPPLTTTVYVAKDAAQVVVPLKTALMVWFPVVANVVGNVTVSGEGPTVGTVPSRVAPSKNATLPPAVLPEVQVTVAVSVVGVPTVVGLGVALAVVVLVPSGMMFSIVVPVAPAQFGLVLVYTAVIVCGPSAAKVTAGLVNVRVSAGPLTPTASVPMTVAVVVSVKVTEPVGSPSPVQVTTAVKVTGWSCVAGFGVPVTVTVVVVALTMTVPSDGRQVAFPPYTAVTVCAEGGAVKVVVTDAVATPPTGAPSVPVARNTGVPVVSKKLTVPVGLSTPPPGQVTVAVRVTAVPAGAVAGVAVTVVVVGVVAWASATFIAGDTRANIPASATASTPTRRINN